MVTIAIDGSVNGVGSGYSLALPGLTTSTARDVIVVYASTNDGGIITATSPHLTFASRAWAGSGNDWIQEFYAVSPLALSGEVITVNCSTNASYISASAFGVSGANTRAPFDMNAVVPAVGTSGPLTVTTDLSAMVIGGFRQGTTATPSAGTSMTLISGANYLCSEYSVQVNPVSGFSVGTNSNADVNGGIVDAIVAPDPVIPYWNNMDSLTQAMTTSGYYIRD